MTKDGTDPLFPPKRRQGWGDIIPEFLPGSVGATEYVKAFEKFGARMTPAERDELVRLFSVALRNPQHRF